MPLARTIPANILSVGENGGGAVPRVFEIYVYFQTVVSPGLEGPKLEGKQGETTKRGMDNNHRRGPGTPQ